MDNLAFTTWFCAGIEEPEIPGRGEPAYMVPRCPECGEHPAQGACMDKPCDWCMGRGRKGKVVERVRKTEKRFRRGCSTETEEEYRERNLERRRVYMREWLRRKRLTQAQGMGK